MSQDNALTVASAPKRAVPRSVSNAFSANQASRSQTTVPAGSGGDAATGWAAVRARIEAMNPAAKTLAARQAEILSVAGQGLAARPYAERKAILAHMAPHLTALGVEGGPVDAFDPTDVNLAQAVGEAVILRGLLGGEPAAVQVAENQTAPAGHSGEGRPGQGLTTAPGAPMSDT